MIRTAAALITTLVLLASGSAFLHAQDAPGREEQTVRIDTTLVTVPVSVQDRGGRYLAGLRREDFRLYEDGFEQQVAFFSPVETPFTVVLLVDASPSTMPILNSIIEVANLFMNRMRPDDRFSLLFFDLKVHELVKPTSRRELRPGQIKFKPKCCGTSLYDAVELALGKRFKDASGRKAVILFTDGVDTTSRATYERTLRRAEEMDVSIYPVRFNTYVKRDVAEEDRKFWRGVWPEDYERGKVYLEDLAQRTGGRMYAGDVVQDLTQAFESIAQELRQQYSLGYYPHDDRRAGQRRRIKVQVLAPGMVVHARESYIYKPAGQKSGKK